MNVVLLCCSHLFTHLLSLVLFHIVPPFATLCAWNSCHESHIHNLFDFCLRLFVWFAFAARFVKNPRTKRTFSLSIAMKMDLSTRFVFCCHNWNRWHIHTHARRAQFRVCIFWKFLLDVVSKRLTNKCKMATTKIIIIKCTPRQREEKWTIVTQIKWWNINCFVLFPSIY